MRQETLLKIIELMRKNLDVELSIFQISKRLKIGYAPAHNHIAEMEKERIITVSKAGNSKQCRLNLENSKTRHLLQEIDIKRKEQIYNKYPKLKSILEALILKLNEKYISEILSIVLFGSYAKGTASKKSDIDLMFILNNLKAKHIRGAIERECANYQYSYNMKISPLMTDVAEFKKMLMSKELNVGKEIKEFGISLYGHELFWRVIE